MSLNPAIHVGCDDGHSEIKIVLPDGTRFKMPSHAQAGKVQEITFDEGTRRAYGYITEDGPYVTGNIDVAEPTNFNDYPFSAMNRVLVHHALLSAGLTKGNDVKICTGLPLKRYFLGTTENSKIIERKEKSLLKKDIVSLQKDLLPNITEHTVFAEGLTAWLDHVSTFDQKKKAVSIDKDLSKTPIAIIDIGGRTTDIAVVKDFNLESNTSATIDAGMLDIFQAIRSVAYETFDEIQLHEDQLKEALTTNSVTLWGKQHDVSEIVTEAKTIVASKIKSTAKQCLGSGGHVHKVIFVGGSSAALRQQLDGWFVNQEFTNDPAFANARGMLKYAQLSM